jgi:hypothetical protein
MRLHPGFRKNIAQLMVASGNLRGFERIVLGHKASIREST